MKTVFNKSNVTVPVKVGVETVFLQPRGSIQCEKIENEAVVREGCTITEDLSEVGDKRIKGKRVNG